MKKYTVIGFYVDNDDAFLLHVQAETPEGACTAATEHVMMDDHPMVVTVLEGHLDCALRNSEPQNLSDYLPRGDE